METTETVIQCFDRDDAERIWLYIKQNYPEVEFMLPDDNGINIKIKSTVSDRDKILSYYTKE